MDKAPLRIFLAHAKDSGELEPLRAEVTLALRRLFGTREPAVTLGLEDHAANFARCGSWDGWAREVAMGIHPTTRDPRYHGVVVPSTTGRVGAATQAIIGYSLGIGKPVLRYSGGGLTKVTRVVKVAERDFKTGWEIS